MSGKRDLPRRPVLPRVSAASWEALRFALLVAYAALCLYPILWIVATSLRSSSEVYRAGLALHVAAPRWANYGDFWRAANVPRAGLVTVALTALCLGLVLLTTSMTAYAVTRGPFPGRRLVLVALAASFLLPGEVLIIPTFYVNRTLGLIGEWRSVAAVVLVMTAGFQAFNAYLLISHFRRLPRELYDAAALDGAGYFQTYRQIAFPLVKPGLAACATITIMGLWNAYLTPLVYLGAQREYHTLPLALVDYAHRAQTAYHLLAAGQILLLAPMVLLFLLLQRPLLAGLRDGLRQS